MDRDVYAKLITKLKTLVGLKKEVADLNEMIGTVPSGKTIEGQISSLDSNMATKAITVGQPAQSNFTINSCVGKRSVNTVQLCMTITCDTVASGWVTIASIEDSDKCHSEIRQSIFAQDRVQESGSSAEFYLQAGRYLQILGGKAGCVYNINLVWLTT